MRKLKKIQIAKICIMSMAVSAFAGVSMGDVAYADTWPDIGEAKIKSAQPHFSGYTVRNIEAWDKETDPYSDLMRARVPLQKRNEAFSATQANPGLNDKTEVMLMQGDYGNSFFNSTIANNSYGNVAFNFWQYTDYFCPWHGAATIGVPDVLYNPVTSDWRARGFEFGIVNIPNQAYINAAHKNGVKAIACVYFDPHFRPGQTINEMFVRDTDGKFKVAKKLVALADEYGIDGYFLNNEERSDERFKEFMAYLSEQGLYTQFYNTDSSFGPAKSQWLKNDEYKKIHDSVFVNYGWRGVDSFVEHAKEIGVDPYKAVFLGIEANQGRFVANNNLVKNSYTSEADKNPLCSIALFTPSDMYQRGIDGLEERLGLKNSLPVHQRPEYQWMVAERERMYFSGVTCDPKDTGSHKGYKREDVDVNDASYWPGVADFKAESSVVRGNKFYTEFNIGKGMQYFVDGKAVNDEVWTNLNDQDILPSWQWWFESEGSKLKADFDFGEKEVRNDTSGHKRELPFTQIGAYNGGSSLVVYGPLAAKNTLRLYKTALDVADTTKARLVYRKTSSDEAKMKLGLIFEDEPAKITEIEVAGTEAKSDEYKSAEVDLAAYKGRKIAAICLVFDGASENYQMNIGRISVSDTDDNISAPQNFKIDRIYDDKQMVFSWKIDSYDNVDKYRVYAESEGKKHFLGGIYDEKLYVKDYFFDKGKEITFSLVKVGKDGKESATATKTVDFSKLPTDIKVSEITPDVQINGNEVRLPAEAVEAEKISFSFKKGGSASKYEAVVNPIKEYTDDETAVEYKIETEAENGVVSVPGVKDGYAYDLTIRPLNSEYGISYRGRLHDGFAKPMTEDDVLWAGANKVSLRSPLTRDWYEVKVSFKKDGEEEAKEIGTYMRGVTPNYHSPISLPASKGEISLELKDYRGNVSEVKIKYDESYKEELIKLKAEYSKIAYNRANARILYDNEDLDNILDELKDKLTQSELVINTLKRNEEKVTSLVKELKDIYAKLHKNENVIKYDFKLVLDGYVSVNFVLKDEKGTVVAPASEENHVYSYTLEKGKKYSYEVSNAAAWGSQIIPKKGSIDASEDGATEIRLDLAAIGLRVVPKTDNTVKRLEKLNKADYEVKVKYSYWGDETTISLADERFSVEEPDTSAVGEKEVKVSGLAKKATFKIMVIPNDTDPKEIGLLWDEISSARKLKEKAEYRYATEDKKEAFDKALEAAEAVLTESKIDVEEAKAKLKQLKEAVNALDGLLNVPLLAEPSANKLTYGPFKIGNIIDGKVDTFAWFSSEQQKGSWIKLTYTKPVKVKKVTIVYPEDVEDDFIGKADIEVKDGENWTKIGEIEGTDKTVVEVEAGKEPVTTEVQIKITKESSNWYKLAEFVVEYEEAKAPESKPEPKPEPKPAVPDTSNSGIPVIPVAPVIPKEPVEEIKYEVGPSIVTEVTEAEIPKGSATDKQILTLPSAKKIIGGGTLKGLAKSQYKSVILPQNKTKISAVITSKALAELALKKVSSFEIRGKEFSVFLNAKNIKALNKLVKTKAAFKAAKLKNGKIKLEVLVNGKKLSAKQLAKLKIKVK